MDKIQIINYEQKTTYTPMANTFEVIKENKILKWFIKKLTKYGYIKTTCEISYHRLTIDMDKVAEMIFSQYYQMMNSGKKPTKVIIGYDQMRKLDLEANSPVNFHGNIRYMENGERKFMGLDVMLNPYIDGLVVI